ncbi:MAG TPA: peptidoglycan-associated lipoprotein Pal [Myxococcota bacterium]|nr:peptidoglycan-associated lipoprotein Pal [Myxococcota bacterium]HNZ03337.1 peptidoglycan-associated lipoprotein Pal [Myxococcota bacterium]HOD08231.1 peptidoglycan-associated lipoprotein Pal [Myxococcota bacterium]HPB49762.1 peptidoglycan-associated lipoprotein Pal [Myxococcota bacterium]HQP94762.1 peptidoglycan-associated lipoprotein Pal [Myxococcota bacterium]
MRIAKFLAVAISLVALASLTACGPKYPDCNSDKQCKDHGEYCFNKTCVKCLDDSHCAQLGPCGTCNQSSHVCVGTTGSIGACCSLDSDCDSNACLKGANEITGHCVECLEGTCGAGMRCVGNKCVPLETECDDLRPCASGKKCESGRCIDDICKIQPIYFDFDEYEIRDDARNVLQANVDCMKERGITNVSLEGHCDDRGSDEYNMSLGKNRAVAAKKFLKTLGLKDKTLSVISYGEEKPTCMDQSEYCWSKNRRVETVQK